ncbi:MAG TPA: hypothetical protein VD970_00835, partial [Acetobacteraceae bacterium]|nr:hypothetical protein [Acetobacteraceae bacterium]
MIVRLLTSTALALVLNAPLSQARTAEGQRAAPAPEARATVRAASHDSFGRVVFDWSSAVDYVAEFGADRILLRFPGRGAPDVAGQQRPPRNVLSIVMSDGGVAINARPGARIRHFRIGNRVIVDVHDAPAAVTSTLAAGPAAPAAEAPPPPAATLATGLEAPAEVGVRPPVPAPDTGLVLLTSGPMPTTAGP